uniref:Anoctamin n=1 Tax=Globodera pallida TaxID=36090 RepID=A0A183C1D0_GLOPA
MPPSYFSDGKRLIDFVLVYEEKELNNSEDKEDSNEDVEDTNSHSSPQRLPHLHSQKRRMYEESLLGLGLELEYANATAINPNIKFVLIHAPFKVLMRQAELMMVRMPVHRNDVRKEWNFTDGFVNACLKQLKFLDFDPRVKKRIEPETYFCQPFVAQHFECFVGYESPETFFSRADRSRMVHDLLIRARYDRGESINKLRFGIDKLLRNRTYTAAFPLHDELNKKAKRVDFEKCSDRQLLYESWVKVKNVFKYQPLDLIQNYFGTKIGFYFAWLGYYTRCLWPISLLGILFMLYGVITVSKDAPRHVPVNATCLYTRITYVIDNWSTIIFAAIMSIWITLFLEGWKRYHAELAYKWNVQGFEPEEEMMRPEFQFRRKKMSKLNPVTKQEEPYIPFMEKACRLCGSAVTVLFFIFLVLALLFGIIVYRVIVLRVFYASTFLQNHHRTLAIWSFRLEQCEAAGCMVELVIQLAVIMVGKQIINAFFEIGYPFIITTQRPVAEQARNIGIWITIINMISNIAVLYYRRPPCSLINQPISRQVWGQDFEIICDDNYELQDKWWIILAFRLVFVLVFELIPDMPTKIVIQLQRERFLMRQAILQRKDTPEELEAAELEEREQTQLATDRRDVPSLSPRTSFVHELPLSSATAAEAGDNEKVGIEWLGG